MKTIPKQKQVIIIEDEPDLGLLLKTQFEAASYQVTLLQNGLAAVARLMQKKEEPPQAVVLDLMLPGRSGYDLINSIKSVWPETKLFIYTAHAEYLKQIPKESIAGYVLKTGGFDKLMEAFRSSGL